MHSPRRRADPAALPLLAALAALHALPAATASLAAQDAGERPAEATLPEGWLVRADHPQADPAEVFFTEMPPGWHVTTGPAVILYDPGHTATGTFRVEMEVYLFDPAGRREAFGFFTGGRGLAGEEPRYTYFLLREGGQYLVKMRRGDATETVSDWTSHDAIRSFAELNEGESTARNVLVLEAGEETVRLLVNGTEVATLPRAGLDLDGVVGLRVNHALNLHVSRLEVTPLG